MDLIYIPLPAKHVGVETRGGLTSWKALVLRLVSFSPNVKGAITALITWHAWFAVAQRWHKKESVAAVDFLDDHHISSSHLEDGTNKHTMTLCLPNH